MQIAQLCHLYSVENLLEHAQHLGPLSSKHALGRIYFRHQPSSITTNPPLLPPTLLYYHQPSSITTNPPLLPSVKPKSLASMKCSLVPLIW